MKHRWIILLTLTLFCFSVFVGCDCGDDDDDNDSDSGDDDTADDDADDDTSDDDSADDDVNDDADDDDDGAFRIAVISDANVAHNDMMVWNHQLADFIEEINARDDIDFVVILGDLAGRFYESWWDEFNPSYDPDATWADCFEIALGMLDNLNVPWRLVPGDKDYADNVHTGFDFDTEWADRAGRNQALAGYLGDYFTVDKPWYTFDHKGVTFFAGNSLAGDMWQASNGMTGSMGSEQLADLENVAAGANPMIFMSHHSGPAILETPGDTTLEDVMSAKAGNVMALFNGHHWAYKEYDYYGVDGYSFGALVDETGYWALVEIDPLNETVSVVNHEDLPYPPDWEDFECTPGEASVSLDDFTGSFHTVFMVQMTTDFWILDLLLATADMGETPFVFWVTDDLGGGDYEVEMTQGRMAYSTFPDYSSVHSVSELSYNDSACELYTMHFDEPCMGAVDAQVTYNLMPIINPWSDHAFCGVDMNYETDFLFEAQMGEDDEGHATFDSAQLSLTLKKADVVQTMQQFILDSYCAYTCNVDGPAELMEPWDQCNAQENGHDDECISGTLTFDDIPDICDTLIGDTYYLPVRFLLNLVETLPENMEVNFKFSGWGHSMELVEDQEDLSQDWTVYSAVFGWDCPETPL